MTTPDDPAQNAKDCQTRRALLKQTGSKMGQYAANGLSVLLVLTFWGSSWSDAHTLPENAGDGYHPPSSAIYQTSKARARQVNWNKLAQDELQKSIYNFPKIGVAKNVILFLGDGMGLSDITASRFFLAQRQGKSIEETELSFDRFPHNGLSKTHTSDRQTADSAGSATAMLCGEKVNFYTVGVRDAVPLYDCTNVEDNKLKSALKHSMDAGKWTGLVTTTRITHATPSAVYAHTADRNGEANIPAEVINPARCPDIGWQLIHGPDNDRIQVLFGGGRANFFPKGQPDVDPEYMLPGKREDNKTLIEDWKRKKLEAGVPNDRFQYITNKTEFDDLDSRNVDYVLGLFHPSHMSYEIERSQQSPTKEPSITEMVTKAIQILKRGDKGFFLFVEGGRIDHAHHDNLAHRALSETVSMADAVQAAVDETDEEDTLIVVTGDHSHVFNIAGYPDIDNPILGTYSSFWEPEDGMPYTTLTYGNGPGFNVHRRDSSGNHSYRMNLTHVNTADKDYVFDAGIPIEDETHGGEDVAIFARGPMSYLFEGVHQQHYIAHALMYASCVGPNRDLCNLPLPTILPCNLPLPTILPPTGAATSTFAMLWFNLWIIAMVMAFW